MPWWLTTIFPALLICFVIGFLLGALLLLRRLREVEADFDRRRIEGEAESDRLRLRVSALRERDERATRLEGEAVELRAQAERAAALQSQLQEAETKAHLVPALERQLTETRERALRADRLEEQVVALRAKLSKAEGQAPNLALPSGRSGELPAATAPDRSAELETMSAELRSTRIELEESRSRTGQLDAELRAALEDRDRLRAEVMRNEQEAGDHEAEVAELEAELASVRAALAAAPAGDERATSGGGPAAGPGARSASDDGSPAGPGREPMTASVNGDGQPETGAPAGPAPSAAEILADTSWQQGRTSLGTAGANHADDLQAINGIGPVMERTLNSFGIRTWEQIASFSKEDIDKVSAAIKSFPGRIERDDWVGGARELLAAGHVPGEDTTDRPLTSNRRRRRP